MGTTIRTPSSQHCATFRLHRLTPCPLSRFPHRNIPRSPRRTVLSQVRRQLSHLHLQSDGPLRHVPRLTGRLGCPPSGTRTWSSSNRGAVCHSSYGRRNRLRGEHPPSENVQRVEISFHLLPPFVPLLLPFPFRGTQESPSPDFDHGRSERYPFPDRAAAGTRGMLEGQRERSCRLLRVEPAVGARHFFARRQ